MNNSIKIIAAQAHYIGKLEQLLANANGRLIEWEKGMYFSQPMIDKNEEHFSECRRVIHKNAIK